MCVETQALRCDSMLSYVNNSKELQCGSQCAKCKDLSFLPFFCFQKVTNAPPHVFLPRTDKVYRFRQTSYPHKALPLFKTCPVEKNRCSRRLLHENLIHREGLFECATHLSYWPSAHRGPHLTPAMADHFTLPVNTSTVTAFVYQDKEV